MEALGGYGLGEGEERAGAEDGRKGKEINLRCVGVIGWRDLGPGRCGRLNAEKGGFLEPF